MTPTAEAPAPAARPKGTAGWKVVLLALVAAPAILVPLLLAGPAEEWQVDLRSFSQRHADYFQVGSFRFGEPDWQPLDEWPAFSDRHEFPAALAEPPARTTSEFAHLLHGEVPVAPQWVTTQRSLPFAYVIPVLNSRALRPERIDILDVKLAAARAFDPAVPEDRAALLRLDEVLSRGFAEAEALKPHQKRKRPPTEGEAAARSLLNALLTAWAKQDDDVAATREVLLNPDVNAPIPGGGAIARK